MLQDSRNGLWTEKPRMVQSPSRGPRETVFGSIDFLAGIIIAEPVPESLSLLCRASSLDLHDSLLPTSRVRRGGGCLVPKAAGQFS